MILSIYSLFTTTLLISLFAIVFVAATSFNNIIQRVPLWAVYVFLGIMGIRLLSSPVEILPLSNEVNSYDILPKLYDVLNLELFTYGEFKLSVINVLFIIWMIGIFVRLVDFCVKYSKFRAAVKQFIKIEDKHILDIADKICNKLNIKSVPEIYMTADNCSPSEYGLFKQKIVLNNATYTDEEMYYILLHEITHHKLKNDLAKCFAKILEIVFWWNPVVYLLYDRIDKLMEIYTDLSVTKNLDKTQKYEYLKCLCNVYKTININTLSSTAFASPVIGRVKESEIGKRFKIVAKGIKNNVLVCIFTVVLTLVCCFSTVLFVFQPFYYVPEEEVPSPDIEINRSNSYIVKEGDLYILHYKDEFTLSSHNREDLEVLLD